MLEAARDVQRENESLQGTVTRLKGLLREARESVEELPVVVEANQLLTQVCYSSLCIPTTQRLLRYR